MTQVNPLDMVAYGIGILSLIKVLKSMYPDVMQPWYADNSGSLGTFDHLERYFKALNCNGPAWGYNPDPTKIILTVHPQILEAGELFVRPRGFRVCTGALYL